MRRYAKVMSRGISASTVAEYLPDNYKVVRMVDNECVLIEGGDVLGIDLDGYVAPRLEIHCDYKVEEINGLQMQAILG